MGGHLLSGEAGKQEEGRRGRDMQHITWECQRVAPQPVPAKGPGAFFN